MSGRSDGSKRPYDLLRRIIGPLAAPVYGAVVARRNRRFDRGVGVKRVPVPVVSVGNLTVGGTGKTPFVMWLCRNLIARGVKPAIAMRGYKAERSGGRSDEAEEYRAALQGVPVIVNPDRHAGIAAFLADGNTAHVVVLDDGFQHRQLHRDLDIVLIDARAGTPDDRLLPWGDLREPVAGLKRAGAVVITHADDAVGADRTQHAVTPLLGPGVPLLRAEHRWSGMSVTDGASETTWRVEWLKGKRVAALCGVARPESFLKMLRATGCDIVASVQLRDHQPVDAATAGSLATAAKRERAQIVVTTAKDFARMGQVPGAWKGLAVARPRLELVVAPSEPLIERVLAASGGVGPVGPAR